MRSYRALVFILAALAAATGCDPAPVATDAGSSADARGRTDAGVPAGWTRCGEYECRTVDVPADGLDVASGTIALPVLRIPARVPAERIGALFALGFQGTGTSTAGTVETLLLIQLPEVLDRFDLIFFDRRGTSAETQLNCGVDAVWLAEYRATALDPVTSADWTGVSDLWQGLADGCAASPPAYTLPSMSSETAARDVDRIRVALGETEISFVTFDYGGLVGASYATLFSGNLRAGVFLAPSEPYGPTYLGLEDWTQVALQKEAALTAFFEACGVDSDCPFHGGEGAAAAAAAYDLLMLDLVENPRSEGGRSVGAWGLAVLVDQNVGEDTAAVVARLASLLATVEAGGGNTELLAAADSWFGPVASTDFLGWTSFLGILLADAPCPPPSDLAAVQAGWRDVQALAPRIGPIWFTTAMSCLHWPTPRLTPAVIDTSDFIGTPPLLVLGGAHHFGSRGAVSMHAALGLPADHFILYDGVGNLALSICMSDAIGSFLLDPTATSSPPFGGVCARGT